MTAEGEEVAAERIDLGRNLAERLRRIGVEENPVLPTDPGDRGEVLDHAGFVVPVDDGDEDGVAADRAGHLPGIEAAIGADRQSGHLGPLGFEEPGSIEDRRVLDARGHDVTPPGRGGPEHPDEGEVVGLRRPAREDDFARLAAEGRGHFAAGSLHEFLRLPTVGVIPARGVPVALGEDRQHRREHAGVDPGGGGVVHVDRLHRSPRRRSSPGSAALASPGWLAPAPLRLPART